RISQRYIGSEPVGSVTSARHARSSMSHVTRLSSHSGRSDYHRFRGPGSWNLTSRPERSTHPIERDIEVENVNSPFADKGEQAALLVGPDQCLDLRERKIPSASDPSGLITRSRGANFRVETARRSGHEIDRNRLPVVRVGVVQ